MIGFFAAPIISLFFVSAIDVKPPASFYSAVPLALVKVKSSRRYMKLRPIPFNGLAHWQNDDHDKAFEAFHRSCKKFIEDFSKSKSKSRNKQKRLKLCQLALKSRVTNKTQARHFFETYFHPHQVMVPPSRSLFTGYYEPEIKGSRTQSKKFYIPIYRRPDDLVNLINHKLRAKHNRRLSAMRKAEKGKLRPYYTRQQIEQGALKGRDLEILYLSDPVDTFFMHIQGSARIRLEDDSIVRLGFDGKNGYPYSSIGRYLKNKHGFKPGDLGMVKLKTWLNADKVRGQKVMWVNKSFIFFRELKNMSAELGPLGASEVPLLAQRSLAVDASYHELGLPIWVSVPHLTHHGKTQGFHHLMIAQDVGSAIRGKVRGDIFWGSGAQAGKVAGNTKHRGRFYVLLPK